MLHKLGEPATFRFLLDLGFGGKSARCAISITQTVGYCFVALVTYHMPRPRYPDMFGRIATLRTRHRFIVTGVTLEDVAVLFAAKIENWNMATLNFRLSI